MKAYEITEAGKEALRSGKYKMVRQTHAQGGRDLVGVLLDAKALGVVHPAMGLHAQRSVRSCRQH